jgi:hypothetical protein
LSALEIRISLFIKKNFLYFKKISFSLLNFNLFNFIENNFLFIIIVVLLIAHLIEERNNRNRAYEENGGGETLPCPNGEVRCSGTCVNLQTNFFHCGVCNDPCAEGYICENSTCILQVASRTSCGSTQDDCTLLSNIYGKCCDDGSGEFSCYNTQANPNRCGSCNPCEIGEICENGECLDISQDSFCGVTKADCGMTFGEFGKCCNDVDSFLCFDTQADEAHCGSCNSCGGGEICENGQCYDPANPLTCGNPPFACENGQACESDGNGGYACVNV